MQVGPSPPRLYNIAALIYCHSLLPWLILALQTDHFCLCNGRYIELKATTWLLPQLLGTVMLTLTRHPALAGAVLVTLAGINLLLVLFHSVFN